MIPKYRAWNKSTKEMYGDDDVVDVDIEKKEILVKTTSCKRLSYNFFRRCRINVINWLYRQR